MHFKVIHKYSLGQGAQKSEKFANVINRCSLRDQKFLRTKHEGIQGIRSIP